MKPPVEKHSYVGAKLVGVCDKCGQPIHELATFEEECFSTKPEGIDWLRNYVSEKLKKAGIIPEDELFELTERIVHKSLRYGTHKLSDGEFACIRQADFEIKWAIEEWKAMPPITSKHFSLKAFAEIEGKKF